eukprot:9744-Hanusia_phi.AAC.2
MPPISATWRARKRRRGGDGGRGGEEVIEEKKRGEEESAGDQTAQRAPPAPAELSVGFLNGFTLSEQVRLERASEQVSVLAIKFKSLRWRQGVSSYYLCLGVARGAPELFQYVCTYGFFMLAPNVWDPHESLGEGPWGRALPGVFSRPLSVGDGKT